ncbi:MAG: DNA translocase FtsK [Vicinamibacteria bacterium]
MISSRMMSRKGEAPGFLPAERLSEVLGVVLMALALMLAVSLVTHSPEDPAWYFHETTSRATENLIGPVGAFLSEAFLQVFGLASYLVAVLAFAAGWNRFWFHSLESKATKLIGLAIVVASLAALLALALGEIPLSGVLTPAGGAVGQLLASYLVSALNPMGAFILLVTILFTSITVVTHWSLSSGFRVFRLWERRKRAEVLTAFHRYRETKRKEKLRERVVEKHAKQAKVKQEREEEEEKARRAPGDASPSSARVSKKDAIAMAEEKQEILPFSPKKGRWNMPPFGILEARREEVKPDEKDLMERAKLLQARCREFAVEGAVQQIHPGPVVTTFEYKPDAGIKYSKITSLADDLCLALQAESVRIDRISGKSTVGVEIPNRVRETIGLRELLESEEFQGSSSRLTLALGKTIDGAPYMSDLAKMPHLLIAGATGSGKSVLLNSLICSIVYKSSPDEVRMILIDPKRIELGVYQDIPHLLTPVVTDPKKASDVLKWVVYEMESRIKMLASEGVRNIDQYNNILKGAIEAGEKKEDDRGEPLRPLPYVMVVIDELADLMMVSSSDVEDAITRLAQMARAVGIHLVLATQRPSVDVITGIIKANFPARIAFRVASRVDSRTILDGNGAEQLLGRGDMLLLPPGSARLVRLHGPFVSEAEVGRLVAFWRREGKPEYNATILEAQEAGELAVYDKDEMFDKAARVVVESRVASVSHLQRRLRLGYSRAARIMDMLEADGIVGPNDGSNRREVLVPKDYFDEVDRQLR